MGSLSVVVQQLRKERERAQKEVHRIDAALAALGNPSVNGAKPRRTLSASARRRIGLAQKKKRWAKRAAKDQEGNTKPKRRIPAAGRRRIVAAQRARWAKAKKSKAAA